MYSRKLTECMQTLSDISRFNTQNTGMTNLMQHDISEYIIWLNQMIYSNNVITQTLSKLTQFLINYMMYCKQKTDGKRQQAFTQEKCVVINVFSLVIFQPATAFYLHLIHIFVKLIRTAYEILVPLQYSCTVNETNL